MLDYSKLLIGFYSIPKHKQIRTFMEIAGYPHYENVSSNILKFFLDPNNEHELKDLVLNSIVHCIDDSLKFNIDVDSIEVEREVSTDKRNRLDILIKTENYIIGIENKIFHYLHNDLEDYQQAIKSYCKNKKKPIGIILSLNKLTQPDIIKATQYGFVNITYEQFFTKIKSNIGQYLDVRNLTFVNYLTDFMKSIENLTPKTMENKALWVFFKTNSKSLQELTNIFSKYQKPIGHGIENFLQPTHRNEGELSAEGNQETFFETNFNALQELINSFTQYIISLKHRVYHLQQAVSQNEFAPNADRQWIYDESCLVHDYTICDKYKIAIDTSSGLNGWVIELFARNNRSKEFLFNTMSKDKCFLLQPFESYESKERLIFKRFDTEVEIALVSERLIALIKQVEDYKKRTDKNKVD